MNRKVRRLPAFSAVILLAGAFKVASGREMFRGCKAEAENVREPAAAPADHDDKQIVSDIDREYQAAVLRNDATTMGRILADDFVLVTGSGRAYTKTDLLNEARSGQVHYEHQEDTQATVRLWGYTAIVTAKLWEKGTDKGEAFNSTLWFSDTYVRTPSGWKYVFGQASLPLPSRSE